MIVLLDRGASREELERVLARMRALGLEGTPLEVGSQRLVHVTRGRTRRGVHRPGGGALRPRHGIRDPLTRRAAMDKEIMQALKSKIRHVPDFPKAGILFYDVTTLLRDPDGFRLAIDSASGSACSACAEPSNGTRIVLNSVWASIIGVSRSVRRPDRAPPTGAQLPSLTEAVSLPSNSRPFNRLVIFRLLSSGDGGPVYNRVGSHRHVAPTA